MTGADLSSHTHGATQGVNSVIVPAEIDGGKADPCDFSFVRTILEPSIVGVC